jgi:hypothetical protein
LHCAAVRPAVNWLRGLWARIAPEDDPVALDARVLLLGDVSVWAPAGGEAAQGLWLHLRLRSLPGRFDWTGCGLQRPCLSGSAVLPSWCVIDKTFSSSSRRSSSRNGGAPTTSLPTLSCLLQAAWRCMYMCRAIFSSRESLFSSVPAVVPPGARGWSASCLNDMAGAALCSTSISCS